MAFRVLYQMTIPARTNHFVLFAVSIKQGEHYIIGSATTKASPFHSTHSRNTSKRFPEAFNHIAEYFQTAKDRMLSGGKRPIGFIIERKRGELAAEDE